MKKSWVKKYIGDKKFYTMVLAIAVPIMIQTGITNFVSLLDNIMIGRTGTEQMSGAAIVNQLIFVYNLCIFGGVSGVGIFTAQYFGQQDEEGIRHTFRYKIWLSFILTILVILLFLFQGENLIRFYLQGDGSEQAIQATLTYGMSYLHWILLGLPAFMIVTSYSGTLRECGETLLPMKAGLAAVSVNLIFNYILIYGKLGFPALGVKGAAIATVLSRYVELIIVVLWTHTHEEKIPFIKGIYSTMKVPRNLIRKFTIRGLPLLFNETLWAAAIAMLAQCYSVRGLDIVAGLNIANTVVDVFNIVLIAMGNAVGIIVGQLLGAGKMEEAKDTDNKLIAFSVLSCIGIAVIMYIFAPLFPQIYNTNDHVRYLAKMMISISALYMPLNAFINASYFTLRSGGKTVITFLFDSMFLWGVSVPLAFVLSRYTEIHVLLIYISVLSADIIKGIIGFILVKKNVWMQNIVSKEG